MKLRSTIFYLLYGAVLLAIVALVLAAFSTLMSWLGDAAAAVVFRWIAVGCTLLWIVNLIVLLLALAVRATISQSPDRPEHSSEND